MLFGIAFEPHRSPAVSAPSLPTATPALRSARYSPVAGLRPSLCPHSFFRCAPKTAPYFFSTHFFLPQECSPTFPASHGVAQLLSQYPLTSTPYDFRSLTIMLSSFSQTRAKNTAWWTSFSQTAPGPLFTSLSLLRSAQFLTALMLSLCFSGYVVKGIDTDLPAVSDIVRMGFRAKL